MQWPCVALRMESTVWEAIAPHAEVVLGYTFATENCLLQRATILDHVAAYDREQGRYGSAYTKGMEAYTTHERLLEGNHADTLRSVSNLASSYLP